MFNYHSHIIEEGMVSPSTEELDERGRLCKNRRLIG